MNFSLILQLLVVVSSDWNAIEGVLYCYQRTSPQLQWELSGSPIAVVLGKQGMAWGIHKEEGDGRSPAGLFSLGPVFGDVLHQSYARNMPFLTITEDLECVDDPDSTYYNQFVTKDIACDWKSSEKMKEIGSAYAIGLVVGHNVNPIKAGKGSAIFMHIWKSKDEGTAGCTAMEENDLNTLVSWLNSEQQPYLIQLPLEEYQSWQAQWDLPALQD